MRERSKQAKAIWEPNSYSYGDNFGFDRDAFAIRLDWPVDEDGSTMAEVIPSGDASPDEALIRKEELELLSTEMSHLSEREQFVLHARFMDGRKLDDIAIDLDVRKQTVHNIQKKAIEKLRTRMKRLFE